MTFVPLYHANLLPPAILFLYHGKGNNFLKEKEERKGEMEKRVEEKVDHSLFFKFTLVSPVLILCHVFSSLFELSFPFKSTRVNIVNDFFS